MLAETNVHTPASRILPPNEPSSLFPGNPEESREKVLGLKNKYWQTLQDIRYISLKGDDIQRF